MGRMVSTPYSTLPEGPKGTVCVKRVKKKREEGREKGREKLKKRKGKERERSEDGI